MLRVQLLNDIVGGVTLQDDPGGLNEFERTLKRSEENDGMFHEFSINLEFNKTAKSFIQQVYENEGIEGRITVNLYEYKPNPYKWEVIYTGELNLTDYSIDEVKVVTNIEKVSFERKFINLAKVDVDLETVVSHSGAAIPATDSIDLTYHSKTIVKRAVLNGPSDWIESGFTPNFWRTIRLGGPNVTSEFNKAFLNTDIWVTGADQNETPADTKNYILKVEEAGRYVFDVSAFNFDLFIDVARIAPNFEPDLEAWDVWVYFQKNNEAPLELFYVKLFEADFDSKVLIEGDTLWRLTKNNLSIAFGTIAETLDINDEIYIWFDTQVDYVGDGSGSHNAAYRLHDDFRFEMTGDTVVPATSSKSIMIYEALEKICQYCTDQQDCFRSDFFGRTDLGYAADGKGSLIAITNGRNLRQAENKQLFGNFEDAFKSINSIYCLGWGFETTDTGTRVIRIEPKSYFYNKDLPSVDLGQVSELVKRVKREFYYSQIEVGYPEIENIDQINSIDEFNTLRRFVSPLSQATEKLSLVSAWRSSGYEIESQRRLIEKTKESRLDDKVFLVCVVRDGLGFATEKNGPFTTITGLIDPETVYNARISPRRMVENWKQVIASNLIRWNESKIFKFSYGEGNYLMTSTKPGELLLAENEDIDLTNEAPLWYNEEYEFEAALTSDQFGIIEGAKEGYVKFQDWNGNECEGYLSNCKHIIEEKKATMKLLRVWRP